LIAVVAGPKCVGDSTTSSFLAELDEAFGQRTPERKDKYLEEYNRIVASSRELRELRLVVQEQLEEASQFNYVDVFCALGIPALVCAIAFSNVAAKDMLSFASFGLSAGAMSILLAKYLACRFIRSPVRQGLAQIVISILVLFPALWIAQVFD
jgi:hypothetical protein